MFCQAEANGRSGVDFNIMAQQRLAVRAARKKRRCSSYDGEISEAPENLLRDEKGRHHFVADKPNGLRVADVAEFRIPAGKAYLPPIAGCSGGMPLSWPVSTSPERRDGQPAAARRVQAARRGRSPQDSLGSRLSLSLAWMDKDMRRGRPGQVDAGEGAQPR